MLKIATLIPSITNIFIETIPIFRSEHRRNHVAAAFRTIIQALCDELEDQSYNLKEAKVYVNPHGLTDEEIDLALSKNKIAAIRSYRDRHRDSYGNGIGLKEVKDIIEKFQTDNS